MILVPIAARRWLRSPILLGHHKAKALATAVAVLMLGGVHSSGLRAEPPSLVSFEWIDGPQDALSFRPTRVNAHGDFVGAYRVPFSSTSKAIGFAYINDTFHPINLSLATFTTAKAINDSGLVVGWYDGPGGEDIGFTWTNGVDNDVDRGDLTHVTDVNNDGVYVGVRKDPSGPGFHFRSPGGDIGQFEGKDVLINDDGTVVGVEDETPQLYIDRDGDTSFIGKPAGSQLVTPFEVNNNEQIAGLVVTPTGGIEAFVYDEGFASLAALPGYTYTEALGIDEAGRVVGDSFDSEFEDFTAALWDGGEVFDLNGVVGDARGGGKLTAAFDIDDNGWVVGYGQHGGLTQAMWRAQLSFEEVFTWITPGFGEWDAGDNWEQGEPPGFADNALIGASGNYAIALESDVDLTDLRINPTEDASLQVILGPAAGAGPIQVRLGTLNVGGVDRTLAAAEASLTLDGLDLEVFEDVTLGGTSVGTAKLAVVEGATAKLEGALRVGDQLASGVLEVISDAGAAASLESGALTVGGNALAPSEMSDVLVQGPGAAYHIAGQVEIGAGAPGFFEVSDGATVTVSDGLNVTLDNFSRLFVHGTGSSLTYQNGNGSLRIEDGAAEFDDEATGTFFAARVGGGDASPGGAPGLAVRNGAFLDLSGDLQVGLEDSGFVAIEQQGRIRANSVNISPPEAVNNTQSATLAVRDDGELEVLDFIIIGSAREENNELLTAPGHMTVESGGQVNVFGVGGFQVISGSLTVDGLLSDIQSTVGLLEVGNAVATFTDGAGGFFETVTVQAPLAGGQGANLVIIDSIIEAVDVTVGGGAGGTIAMTDGRLDVDDEIRVEQNGAIAGTGVLLGHVTGPGHVSPGLSPGKLTIEGDYTQEAGGTLELEIGGLSAESQHDVLEVTGAVDLNGQLLLRFIDGFAPQQDDTFELLQVGGGLDLSQATFAVENLEPSFAFDVTPTAGGLQLTALNNGVFVPEPSTGAMAALAMIALRTRRRRGQNGDAADATLFSGP